MIPGFDRLERCFSTLARLQLHLSSIRDYGLIS